jgi:hypothetical protein
MSLKFKVSSTPKEHVRFWLKYYDSVTEIPDIDMPFIKETLYHSSTEILHWTLDIKLHNFLKNRNIHYSLEYREADHYWYIIFLSKKDATLFKLYWVSVEEVYDNY